MATLKLYINMKILPQNVINSCGENFIQNVSKIHGPCTDEI